MSKASGPTPGEPGKMAPNPMEQIVQAAVERTSQDVKEIEALRRENAKLRSANERLDAMRGELLKAYQTLAEERLDRIKLLENMLTD